MWPLSWPIKVSQIPKSCEKLWDFIQKYFHLNSLAVYNSSAKNQTPRLWRSFTKKNKWTQWGLHILTSILTSHMMVTKNPQIVHKNYFWAILLTFIFDVKIDVNICEPHYVNLLFFVNLLHSLHVWLFDIWHLFDKLTSFWHFDTSIKLKPPQPIQGYFMIDLSCSCNVKRNNQSKSYTVFTKW